MVGGVETVICESNETVASVSLTVTVIVYVPGVDGAVQRTVCPDELERVPPLAFQV